MLGPWYGSGCPDNGKCGCGGAGNLAGEFLCQFDNLKKNDIPFTVYLFDGSAWSNTNSYSPLSCSGPKCCDWKLGDDVIKKLQENNIRALLHFWGGCHQVEHYQRAYSKLGKNLLGFYLDDGGTDAEAKRVIDYMWSIMPGNSEVNLKKFQDPGRPQFTQNAFDYLGNACYVGDLPYDFAGMKSGIERVFLMSKSIPAPYNEFAAYAYANDGTPDEETYIRRIHFGCFQPIMANTPYANTDPWLAKYTSKVVETYRYYSWLHKQLVPYLYSYAYNMHENPGQGIMRGSAGRYSAWVGNEIFVAFVTSATRTIDVTLPGGQWINYWDETQTFSGTATAFPVPLGKEPIFIRSGAIIPMDVERGYTGHGTAESQGSLSVLVYPKDSSSFRYRDDSLNTWLTFTANLTDTRLTLRSLPRAPKQPVIYRIGRWNSAPTSVAAGPGVVTVNQGGDLPPLAAEKALNASAKSAWFYDAAAKRLLVKAVPGDTSGPQQNGVARRDARATETAWATASAYRLDGRILARACAPGRSAGLNPPVPVQAGVCVLRSPATGTAAIYLQKRRGLARAFYLPASASSVNSQPAGHAEARR